MRAHRLVVVWRCSDEHGAPYRDHEQPAVAAAMALVTDSRGAWRDVTKDLQAAAAGWWRRMVYLG